MDWVDFSFHQYGTKEAGDVSRVPPGWEHWHALVRLKTHTGSICMSLWGHGLRSPVTGGELAVLQLLAVSQRYWGEARGQLWSRLPHWSHSEYAHGQETCSCSAHNLHSISSLRYLCGEIWSFILLESAVHTETDVLSQFGGQMLIINI